MKKVSVYILLAMSIIITSCSSSRKLATDKAIKNTGWLNLSPTTLENEKGVMINSLYFTGDSIVIMKTGVGQDSTVIATPNYSKYGTYTYSGNLKDGIQFKINTQISTIGPKIDYEGLITPEGMVLIEPDSTAYIYYQLQTK